MPTSHSSTTTTNNGGSSYYSSRSGRDSAASEREQRRGDRDKDWSSRREWRRDRSRERDKDRNRSPPSRISRFPRGRGAISPDDSSSSSRRVSRFGKYGSGSDLGGGGGSGSRHATTPTPTTTTTSLIREKDLLQNPGLTSSILHGGSQYGSYHFTSASHFSQFPPGYGDLGGEQTKSLGGEKDPKSDPKFKAAVETLIASMKTRGDYDEVRKQCLSDVDTKAAFINLHSRVKTTVDKYLGNQKFTKDTDKVKTREGMRKKLLDTPYFEKGIESVVNQILTPKISSLIRPKIEEEVFKFLNVDRNGGERGPSPEPPPEETHLLKHENIETREILPASPIYKEERKRVPVSRIIGVDDDDSRGGSVYSPGDSQQPYSPTEKPGRGGSSGGDGPPEETDRSDVCSSEKSPEIEDDSRMEESSGATTPPPPPPEPPASSSVILDVRVPPPPLPGEARPPPLPPQVPQYPPHVGFGHITHFHGLSVLPPAHNIMDCFPPIPPSIPPLPPLPAGLERPPSPPKPPPPPPGLSDDACSSPPGGGSLMIAEEEEEPLPPGEEPDSYFSSKMPSKPAPIQPPPPNEMSPPEPPIRPPPPPPPEDIPVPDTGEDSEDDIVSSTDEESPMFEKLEEVSPPRIDSEDEESPTFEKLSEVSPLRPFHGGNSLTNDAEADPAPPGDEDAPPEPNCSPEAIKFLESIPNFDYKVSFYKRLKES